MTVKLAVSQGSIASRMRHWEPVRFGPELRNSIFNNIDAWTELEYSPAKIIKKTSSTLKEKVKEGVGKKLDING